MRPHLYVLNKTDLTDVDTNEAVRSMLIRDHGVEDVLFISCKQTSSIKHKVCDAALSLQLTSHYIFIIIVIG